VEIVGIVSYRLFGLSPPDVELEELTGFYFRGVTMKLNAIGLVTACSLLCVAFCQPIEARSIRGDQGQNGWDKTASSFTSSPYSLNPGVSTPFTVAIGNDTASMLLDDVQLSGASAVKYNWYASATSFSQAEKQVTPLEQVVVYNLGGSKDLVHEGSQVLNLAGDTEIEFNYDDGSPLLQSQINQNPNASAQFTIGGITYSADVANIYSPTSQNDFVFSKTGAFIGALITTVDASGDTSLSLSPSLGAWTKSGGSVSAPEIDSSSVVTALTLLGGALVLVRGNTRYRARIITNG
jgi:hypothetical protein